MITPRQKQAGKLFTDKQFFQESDVVFSHGILPIYSADELDKPSVMMNHSLRRHETFLYDKYKQVRTPLKQHYLDEYRDQVIQQIKEAAQKPDVMISNSEFIRQKTLEYFDRDSTVINPPIDRNYFKPRQTGDKPFNQYYIFSSRAVWYKGFSHVIKAFKDLDENLVITGPENDRNKEKWFMIRKLAEPHNNIKVLGYVEGEKYPELISQAEATIQASFNEDFGYIPREGMACGTPCIVPNSGGLKTATHNGKTGVKYSLEETPVENIKQAVQNFESENYDAEKMRSESDRYDIENIAPKIKKQVVKAVEKHQKT